MKKIFFSLLLGSLLGLTACNDDDVTIVTTPSATGTVTDDMGNTYGWVRVGNLDWTTSNALNGLPFTEYEFYNNFEYSNVTIPVPDGYEDKADFVDNFYVPTYGNLMCYADALTSAPEGWRLPTDEDWKALERALGMTDADNKGWRGRSGVAARLTATESGLGLGLDYGGGTVRTQVYGWMEMSLNSVWERGYYWTATAEPAYEDVDMAYFRKIVSGYDGVERQCSQVENLMSVRWCRDTR